MRDRSRGIEASQRQRLRPAERTIMTNRTNGRERSRAGGVKRRFWAWAALLILVLAAVPAAAEHPVQIYYLPLPEEEILTAFQGSDTSGTPLAGDTSIRTVVGITVTQTGTIIYYDQWENDFETEIDDPDDLYSAGNPGGTQIWGDGDTSNGFPPGYPGRSDHRRRRHHSRQCRSCLAAGSRQHLLRRRRQDRHHLADCRDPSRVAGAQHRDRHRGSG